MCISLHSNPVRRKRKGVNKLLDVEANVVTGKTLNKLLVVHLDGLDFGGNTSGGEGNDHTSYEDVSK